MANGFGSPSSGHQSIANTGNPMAHQCSIQTGLQESQVKSYFVGLRRSHLSVMSKHIKYHFHPDDRGGAEENCAAMLRNSGEWDDIQCSAEMSVLCEKTVKIAPLGM